MDDASGYKFYMTDIDKVDFWQRFHADMDFCEYMDKREPNARMEAGIALHKAFERIVMEGMEYRESLIIQDDHIFDVSEVNIELERAKYSEERIRLEYPECWFSGRYDWMNHDGTIFDLKTTSNVNFERLIDSMQWRMYLTATNSKKFTYAICRMLPPKKKWIEKIWRVREFYTLDVYRYPGMEEDVRKSVKELLALTTMHNWKGRPEESHGN